MRAGRHETSLLEAALGPTDPGQLVRISCAQSVREVAQCCGRQAAAAAVFGQKGALGSGWLRGDPSGQFVLETEADVRGDLAVRFELFGVLFVLFGRARTTVSGAHRLAAIRLHTVDRRLVGRQSLIGSGAELVWCAAPAGQPMTFRSTVEDMTPRGIGLRPTVDAAVLPPGRFPAALRVGERWVSFLAERTVDEDVAAPRGPRGLRISGLESREQLAALVDAYVDERFPSLAAREEIPESVVRTLMQGSGYAQLRSFSAEVFGRWHQARLPSWAGRDVVYRAADGTPLGQVSVTEIYPRTWMLHQLATLSGHPETIRCRRELYGFVSTLPALVHGTEASVLAYFNQSRRWHQTLLQRFVRWVDDPELATIVPLDRFERLEAMPAGCATAEPAFEISPPRGAEVLQAVALIRSQLPPLLADAWHVEPHLLQTDCLADPAVGRARQALVLRVAGELAGVALCETGPTHLSLFNLLNAVQLFVCPGDRRPSAAAQLGLLAAARRLYAERGIHSPVVVAPAGTCAAAAEPGTKLAETMGCLIMSGRAIRHWENFLKFQFGRLYDRRRSASPSRPAVREGVHAGV